MALKKKGKFLAFCFLVLFAFEVIGFAFMGCTYSFLFANSFTKCLTGTIFIRRKSILHIVLLYINIKNKFYFQYKIIHVIVDLKVQHCQCLA